MRILRNFITLLLPLINVDLLRKFQMSSFVRSEDALTPLLRFVADLLYNFFLQLCSSCEDFDWYAVAELLVCDCRPGPCILVRTEPSSRTVCCQVYVWWRCNATQVEVHWPHSEYIWICQVRRLANNCYYSPVNNLNITLFSFTTAFT